MSPEANTNVARSRQRLACANAHKLQVYGWMRWKLSEHPAVPTTTRATALECVLSESNPNRRAAVCVSCLMHCCQRPSSATSGGRHGVAKAPRHNKHQRQDRLACANARKLQVYGWVRWKLSEHPAVPTTTRATALECVLSESNPNPRAAFCASCLMHCCQRPTFSVQRLSKTNWLVSANISTMSCLTRLPAGTAEPPDMVILAGGWPAPHPLASPPLRGQIWLS